MMKNCLVILIVLLFAQSGFGQNNKLKEGFYYRYCEGNTISWIQITQEYKMRDFYTSEEEYCLFNQNIDYSARAKKVIVQFWENFSSMYSYEDDCNDLDFINYEIRKDTLIIYDDKYVKNNISRYLINSNRLTYLYYYKSEWIKNYQFKHLNLNKKYNLSALPKIE